MLVTSGAVVAGLVGAVTWLVVLDTPWRLRLLAGVLLVIIVLAPLGVWLARALAPGVVPALLQWGAIALVWVYIAGAAAPTGAGWAWPATVWPDLFADESIVIDVVDGKREEFHTHCGQYGCSDEWHYWIEVGGREWAVSEATYSVLNEGELVELAFLPHTKLLAYVAYGPALSDTRAKNEVRLAVGLAPIERKVLEEEVLPVIKRRTGLDVSFVQIESGRLVDLLEHVRGSPFDLLAVDNNRVGVLAARGLVQDLTPDAELIPDQTLPALDAVTRVNEKVMFFPFRPNVMVGYYNTAEFDQRDVVPPRTWDELMAVAQTLKDAGTGVALQGAPGPPVATQVVEFIRQAGGDPLVLNDPGSVEAFTFLQQLAPWLSGRTNKAQYDTVNRYLARGTVSLAPNWAFGVRDLVVDRHRADLKVYPGWAGPRGQAHVLGGDVLGVPTLSHHRRAALAVAEQLMSKRIQGILARELFWPSMRTDAYDTIEPKLAPYWDAINEAMANATARPTIPCWTQVEDILSRAWHDIIEKGQDVQARLDFYAADVARLATADAGSCVAEPPEPQEAPPRTALEPCPLDDEELCTILDEARAITEGPPDQQFAESIAAAPDRGAWFTTPGDAHVRRVSPDGTVTAFEDPEGMVRGPSGIAVASDGSVWFASRSNDRVGRLTPDGNLTTFWVGPECDEPINVAAARDDASVWVACRGGGIAHVTTGGDVSVVPTANSNRANLRPFDVATTDDGTIWLTSWDSDVGTVAKLTQDGDAKVFVRRYASELEIAAAPDGSIWFTDWVDDRIGHINPSGDVTTFSAKCILAGDIIASHDGGAWFACQHAIGRISPRGAVTITTRDAEPTSLALDADGNIWFTSFEETDVGRMTPDGTVTTFEY